MLINRIAKAFSEHKVEYAIVGGFAVALHGAVRGTMDIDVILRLRERQFQLAESALKSMGLVSRLPVEASEVFRFREEYIRNRNLIAWSFYNPKSPAEIVDIIITHDLEQMKTKTIKSGTQSLKVLAIADLIKMKRASGRPQDLEDIRALEQIKK